MNNINYQPYKKVGQCIAFITIIFIFLLVTLYYSIDRFYCIERLNFSNEKVVGIVSNKFIDVDNHGLNRIDVIENIENYSNSAVLYLNGESKSKVYNLVMIGDSIVKEKNSLTIKVYRKGVKIDEREITFFCN